MRTKIYISLVVSMVLSIIAFNANAQIKTDSINKYSYNAAWIDMIDNPNANYFEAIKAYDTYFKFHKKPKDEDDSKMSGKDKDDDKDFKKDTNEADDAYLKSLSPEELNKYAQLKYQVKRFENWIREMKPFVQEDGRILTDEERAAIWRKQQDEIKKQQK